MPIGKSRLWAITTRAAAIEGWMSPQELKWLAERASTRRTIVEVGSWMGRSTKAMSLATLGRVYAVDTWAGSAEHQHKVSRVGGPDALYERFRRSLKAEIAAGKCIPVREDSAAAAAHFKGKADMVFIDANHAYGMVKRDILAWRPLLKPGGLLCGHDHNSAWPGVMKAVSELVPKRRLVAGTSIWWFKE